MAGESFQFIADIGRVIFQETGGKQMNMKYSAIPLAVAVLVGMAKPSMAQNVQAFAMGEAQRINQDVATGRVNPNQAQGLETREMQIQQQTQQYAMRNGGYLTSYQQWKINSELKELDRRRKNDENRNNNGYGYGYGNMGYGNMLGYGTNMMGYNPVPVPVPVATNILPYGTGLGSGMLGYGTGLGSGYGSGLGSLARNVLGSGNTMYAGYTPHSSGILGGVGNTLLNNHASVPFAGNYATPFSQGTPKHTWHL